MSNRLGQQYNRYNGNTQYQAYISPPMNYSNNIDKDIIPLSIINEPEIHYTKRIDYITISSKERDIINYPSPSQYVVNLPNEFRNVHSIEIINGVIPDQNNVRHEPYLLLNIQELVDVITSTDPIMSNSFAILHLACPITPGYFINVDKKTFEHVVLTYKTPKASLSKLTISITDSDGNLFNFGDDSSGPLKSLQNMFVLRIITLEKNRDSLNHRNVY